MPLIVEDGSQVAGANSFTTDAELTAYALARGVTLPATEAERDVLQIKAVDYLFSKESQMQGSRIAKTQALMYPRNGVSVHGFSIDSDEIPEQLKSAQLEAAIALSTQEILVNSSSSNITKEKVDVIEVEYSDGGKYDSIRLDKVDTYLKPLLTTSSFSQVMRA